MGKAMSEGDPGELAGRIAADSEEAIAEAQEMACSCSR
jgi:hypothetical protein